MAFERLYMSDSAIRSLCESLISLKTPFYKELLLPIPTYQDGVVLKRIVRLALFLRYSTHTKNFNVSFDRKLFYGHNKMAIALLGDRWLRRMYFSKQKRRFMSCCPECVTGCRQWLNKCACIQIGAVICAREDIGGRFRVE